ncbi:hypothetical protein ABIA23_004294 [Sinorhizobium fredii]
MGGKNGMLAERCDVQAETTLPASHVPTADISLRTFRGTPEATDTGVRSTAFRCHPCVTLAR